MDFVHTGTISTGGVGGEADRDLGDFFTNDVDSKGRMIVTFGNDGDDGLNARGSAVMFGKQLEGPFLLEGVGPVALFENVTSGLTVSVDASESHDLGGVGIAEYVWDWGDGSNGTGMIAQHKYNNSGDYTIQLKVINEDDMRASAFANITVEKEEVPADYTLLFIILSIILICVVVYIYFTTKKQKKEVEVEPIPVEEEVPEIVSDAQVVKAAEEPG
jgi:cbb3-type cytochrome oxidase subunit 3